MSQSATNTAPSLLEYSGLINPLSASSAHSASLLELRPSKTSSIAFVDSKLSQLEELVAGITADKVVLIDSQTDGIEQITAALAQANSLTSVHIFSHANQGVLQLGNAALDAENIEQYRDRLSQWGNALLGQADIMLYGCDLTASEAGRSLVNQISHLTQADVAASNDLTGFGGDWLLETQVGAIESEIALIPQIQSTYAGTLALLNSSFEANLAGWDTFTGTETTTAVDAFDGKSLRLAAATSGVAQTISATVGETYTLTSYAKSSSEGYSGIGINFFDENFNSVGGSGQQIESNIWSPYQIQAVAKAGTRYVQTWAYKDDGNGIFLIDDFALATDGTAPPEPPVSSGDELLLNPGFESGFGNWDKFSGTETLSTTAYTGSQSLQLSAAGSGAGQIVSGTAGQEYNLSLYGQSSSAGYVGAGLNFFDADFNLLDTALSNEIVIDSSDWQAYQQSAIAPSQTRYVQVWTYQNDADGNTFLDDISIQLAGDPPVADTTAPTATLSASAIATAGSDSFDFTLTYTDDTAVDISSLDNRDIRVTGPNGFSKAATFVSVDTPSNGTPRTATYRLAAPTGGWNTSNNGAYAVRLRNGQVQDTQGNQTAAAIVGRFDVNIAPTSNFGNISLAASNITVSEADGTAILTVLRQQGADGTITVDYSTLAGTASAGTDFTPVAGTLTFADGEIEKTVTVDILNDSLAEGRESFGFAIDNVNGGATLLAPRTAQVAIDDDDSASYRGNQYLFTTGAKTWEQAQAEAESLGGNLVTINAAAEEAWLKQTFGSSEEFWIGLNDRATEGQFEWASGEAVVYTNWTPGEPNNDRSADPINGQDYAQINYSSSKQWDDLDGSARLQGIIEIGGDNSPDTPPQVGNGLKGEYYDNIDFTNPVLTRTDATVNFDWERGSPASNIGADTFSVRWSGRIEPRYSETYTFRTTSDDGIRLWVNDQLIIDKFIDQAPTNHTGTIALEAGEQYDIRLEYYERGGGAVSRLAWSSASQPLEIVPQSQLFSEVIDTPPTQTLVKETLISGLTNPTAIEWQPNTNRMFITEKGGIVKIFENGELNATPFIDISDQVNGTRDRGLLDLAIHPDFTNNPYVYLLYTYDPPEVFNNTGEAGPDGKNNRAARLTRVTADASTNYTTAIPGSEVVLLGKNSTWDNFNGFANSTTDFDEPAAGLLPDGTYLEDILVADSESHTIGAVEFGPDGALYVSNGDGASYNRLDPRATRVQDIDSLSGKVLRIDPITGAGLPDNPFFDSANANANRSKVYQYGLRNPFRITIDQSSGELYIGDVGWTRWEEINSAGAGANFGWPYYEGGDGSSLQTGGYKDLPEAIAFYNSGAPVEAPLLGLSHSQTGINAIVLGDIYTGDLYPDKYKGDLFYNDIGQGILSNVSLDATGNITDVETFTTGTNLVVHIAEGPDDLLYYIDLDDGQIGRWTFEDAPLARRQRFQPLGDPQLEELPSGQPPSLQSDFLLNDEPS